MNVSGLAPNTIHVLVVDGVEEQEFVTKPSGRAALHLRQPAKRNQSVLDFDPRGRLLTINQDTNVLLFIAIASTNEPSGIRVSETVVLDPTTLAGKGRAVARFRIQKDQSKFSVEVEKLAAGAYRVAVGGIERGDINVGPRHRGKIEFDSNPEPPELLLDFDPRGEIIDITQETNLFFSSQFLASGQGVSECSESAIEWPLVTTSLDADAHAEARFRVRENCRRDFQVEAEDLDPGDYDLLVDGVVRGVLQVVAVTGGTQGELEFSTELDEENELPLSFDPLTELIEIRQGTNVFFSGSGSPTTPDGTNCSPVSTELPLLNSGSIVSAKGKARYRLDDDCSANFRVEIEDLPIDAYALQVGGTNVGTINVVDVSGDNRGEIEFDSHPDQAGELPLTFDPRGQLLEVKQGDTVILSRSFP
jgi:hypothetical protein